VRRDVRKGEVVPDERDGEHRRCDRVDPNAQKSALRAETASRVGL